MNVVLFSHPVFLNSQSMTRFARMLEQAYVARGHQAVSYTHLDVYKRQK